MTRFYGIEFTFPDYPPLPVQVKIEHTKDFNRCVTKYEYNRYVSSARYHGIDLKLFEHSIRVSCYTIHPIVDIYPC